MKLAYSTIGCPEWEWDEVLSTASDLGYRGIEIRGVGKETYAPAIAAFSPTQRDHSMESLKRLNLTLTCLTSTCTLGQADGFDAALAEGRAYIDLAAALGVPFVRVLGETTAAPEAAVDDALVAKGLRALAEHAQGTGVTVLLETSGHYADTHRLAALFDGLDTAKLGILWDVHHPFRFAGEAPQETLAHIGKWVKYIHLKDSVLAGGRVQYRMLGDGDLPLREMFDGLRTLGYDGWYTLEWVRRWDMTLEEPGIAFARFAATMQNFA